jgi:GDP-4-dehydro-6-deoxy-D-mannose reductase
MRLLITGANGFVGQHVMRAASAIPLNDGNREIDLRDAGAVLEGVKAASADRVIHLAAVSHVPTSFADPRGTFETNFLGTLNLLEALRKCEFRGRLLYVGSADTYGAVPPERLPVIEDQPQRPRNPYAVSKVASEALCYQWSQVSEFQIVIARPFNHIGPGQGEAFVVSSLAKQVVAARRGLISSIRAGDLQVTRDFTDVRDVVRAYVALLESGESGEAYNVCSGVERSLESVLGQLMTLAGVHADICKDDSRVRSGEQRRMRGSFDKLQAATGWKPFIAFEHTLAEILNFWEQDWKWQKQH